QAAASKLAAGQAAASTLAMAGTAWRAFIASLSVAIRPRPFDSAMVGMRRPMRILLGRWLPSGYRQSLTQLDRVMAACQHRSFPPESAHADPPLPQARDLPQSPSGPGLPGAS